MPGPFDDLIPANGRPATQSQPSQPTVQAIPGRVDPYRQRADARAEEDQSMQRIRDARDAETKAQQAQLDAIRAQGAQFDLEAKRRNSEATGGIDGSVDQGKAAAFFKRAIGSNTDYEKAGLDPDSMIGQNISGVFPNATAALSSDERNAQRSREREFIAAVLRYDSGAAIPPSEFENAYQIYFPTSSAGPEEIAQKRIARQRAIEGLKLGAGPVAARVGAGENQDDNDPTGAFPGGIAFNDEPQPKTGYRMSPQNEAAYQAFIKSQLGNPNASLESVNGFLTAIGEQPLRDDEKAAALIAGMKAGEVGAGVDYSTNDTAQRAEYERLKKERENLSADPIVRGVADTATLGFADELAALGDTVTQGGNYQENLYTQRATDRADEAVNPNLRIGGQVLGALALPSGIGRATAQGGVRAGAVRAGQEGAAFGGAYGFGSGEDLRTRSTNALLGAGGGAAIGYGVGRALPPVINALGSIRPTARNALDRLSPARAEETALRQEVAGAAERQGVDLLPADVGGAGVKGLTSAAAQAPVSAGSIQKAAQSSSDQLGEAAARAAPGKVLPSDQVGESGRKAIKEDLEQSRQKISSMYDQAERQSGGVRPKFTKTIAMIDAEIARKGQAGGMADSVAEELNKVKQSLQSGKVTVIGIREARKVLGPLARTEKLRGTDAERIFKAVLNSASEETEAALASVGKDRAASLFKRADGLWRERIEEIDTVFEPIIGKTKSGEDIVKAIESMSQGNRGGLKRLAGMMRRLPKTESNDMQATILDRMGRARSSAQNDAGDVWSAETFLTNWDKMREGRAALFPDPELRAALSDIAKLASAKRQTNALASRSNTPIGIAGNVASIGGTAGLAGAAAGGAGGALAGTAITLLGQYGLGKLLASKSFAQWLSRLPKVQGDAAQKAYVQRLERIATREPAVTAEIIQFKDYLTKAQSEMPGRAAASDDQENERRNTGGRPPQN